MVLILLVTIPSNSITHPSNLHNLTSSLGETYAYDLRVKLAIIMFVILCSHSAKNNMVDFTLVTTYASYAF